MYVPVKHLPLLFLAKMIAALFMHVLRVARIQHIYGIIHYHIFRCKITHYFCNGKIIMGKYSNWEHIY